MQHDKHHKGHESIRQTLYKEFPDINPKDINRIMNGFWNYRFGIAKYLHGFESFSVKRLFFFIVKNDKLEKYKDKVRKSKTRREKKYRKNRKRRMKKNGY